MFLCVCPSPCIDKNVYLDKFNLHKLNRIKHQSVSLSGKAMNVGVVLKRLSEDVLVTGFMFENDKQQYHDFLQGQGIEYDYVYCKGDVRQNIKVIEEKGSLTEINSAGEKIGFDSENLLYEKIESIISKREIKAVILSGSLAHGMSENFYSKVCKLCSKVPCIVDSEGDRLLDCLKFSPHFIKPNLYELEILVKRELKDDSEIVKACKELCEMGAKNVICSAGERGAFLVNRSGEYFFEAPKIEVVSSVGAGDSMLACAIWAYFQKKSFDQILQYSVIGGTSACLTEGTNLLDRRIYEKMLSSVLKIENKE